jgi:TolB-like protein
MIETLVLTLALASSGSLPVDVVATANPALAAATKPAKKKAKTAPADEVPPLVEPPVAEPATAAPAPAPVETAPAAQPAPAAVEHVGTEAAPPAADTGAAEPRDVELRLRKLADQLAADTSKLSRNPRYLRFAVLPFEAVDADSKDKGLGLVVTDVLATTLLRDHRLALVERARLNAVLGEMALQQTGVTDDSKAAEVGKIANADVLILGQVALLGDRYKVTAKMLETETARVASVVETDLPAADLVALSSNAVVLRSKADAAFRSVVLPGWGQHYNQEATKGWVFTGVTGALLLGGIGFETAGLLTHLLYYVPYTPESDNFASSGDPQFQRNLQDRYNLAQTQFVVGHVLLGATAAVWAYNVLDAYISGVEGSEMLGSAGD